VDGEDCARRKRTRFADGESREWMEEAASFSWLGLRRLHGRNSRMEGVGGSGRDSRQWIAGSDLGGRNWDCGERGVQSEESRRGQASPNGVDAPL
jgi:hypothetical protein